MRYNNDMANRFTDEQLKAIETTDRSVLVSAAAGSGKTTVLIERIIRIILDGKANVDEMLVVTFTNAAAAEMKLRLSNAIRKRMAENPEDAPRMKDQLSRLYKAYISTIDSFAMRVIKEFFHETDLEPSFAVCDDVQGELMRREAVSELFEAGFENDSLIEGGSFRDFLRLYSDERSDERLMEEVIKSYSKLRSMPDYFEWAYEKAEQLKVTPDTFDGSALKSMMLKDAAESFGRACSILRRMRELFETAGLQDMYEAKFASEEAAYFDIYSSVCSGRMDASVMEAISSIPTETLRASSKQKEAYESIKDEVLLYRKLFRGESEDFRKRYLMPDFETCLSEMNASYGYTIYYLRLLEEFERRYEEKKRESRLIDFADMEHYAVRILRNDDAADIMRRRFRFIFVDEYQDTNRIQESLISRVSGPDNVFRVGDVKQSIYKFRQAEPEIFEELYARYSGGEDPDGMVVDLGRNYRTNDRTIKYINHVFSSIMEGYDERAMLYTGVSCSPEYDLEPEVHLLYEPESSAEDDDDDIKELTKDEAEAEYIAKLAASVIGTEFYDTKAQTVRKAGPRDIVILLRAIKNKGELISRALREQSLEPHIEETEDYFDTVEVSVALSLLMTIDNMKRDVPLIAALHSEVFGFSPDELAEIRIAHTEHLKKKTAYHEAFGWYASEGPEGALKAKAAAARDSLLEWRRLSRMMPLDDFVWKLLVDSGYYSMAGAMGGGAARQANLRSLADRAGRFSKDTAASLSSFITFVELLKSRKTKTGQTPAAGSDDEVVRVSTIHKSKGLEYPFVIVGGLGKQFNETNNEKGFSFDSGTGVGISYVDPDRKYWRSTPIQRAITEKSRSDGYKEELRLLYVAMTRARNKLFLVGTYKSEEDIEKFAARPKCFLDAMQGVLRTEYNRCYIRPLDLTRPAWSRSSEKDMSSYLDSPLTAEEQALYDEIDRRFSYRYPYEDQLSEKAKYSVSELRRESERSEGSYAVSNEQAAQSVTEEVKIRKASARKKHVSAADIGTAYHRIMEFLDFRRAVSPGGAVDEGYIRDRAELLHENNAIEDEIFRELDLSKIADFFRSDIGMRASQAAKDGTLRREKPFTLKTEYDGREILVQGVIDCCFEENGKMILIDYKSSYIDVRKNHDEEIARIMDEYKVQIDLYREAVQKGTGKEVAEAYLWLFATAEAIPM